MSTHPDTATKSQLNTDTLISAQGLVKRFGSVTALNGLDLEVIRGEVHAFLGPNGAGKTTTIRALLGQLRIDAGELRVLGHDPWREVVPVHRRLAYVPGDTTLWPSLTGGECIDILGRLQGNPNRARRSELIERFELDPSRRTRSYSKGNRQKIALIAALATDVELLLLDEPTSGLDPLMEARFQDCIRDAIERGQTVLLSSHILEEVEALADRITIVREGRSVKTGTITQLHQNALTLVEAVTSEPIPNLRQLAGVVSVHEHHETAGVHAQLQVQPAKLPDVVTMIATHRPSTFVVHPPDLQALFLEQYESQPEKSESVQDVS